jgi:NADH-quinone oxidoreductase subunit A
MQYAFLPVFLLVVCVIGLAVGLLVVASLFNPGHSGRVTRMPYESGMDPIHDTRRRFDVRFNLLAIAFMLFDVELLFLYPWAVAVRGERNNDECRMMKDELGAGRDDARRGLGGSPPSKLADGRGAASTKSEQSKINPKSPIPSSSTHPSSFIIHHSPHSLVFAGAMTFVVLLTLGYVYDWRKGIFQWR